MRGETRAVAAQFAAAAGFSVLPLAVALAGDGVSPFLFHVYYGVAAVLTWVVALLLCCRRLAFWTEVWAFTGRQFATLDGTRALAGTVSVLLFVAAARFLDPAVVTVAVNAWPILFVHLQRAHNATGRYRRLGGPDWACLSASFLGLALVTLAQSGSVGWGGRGWGAVVGCALAVCSAVVGSWTAYRFKIGVALHRHLTRIGSHRAPASNGERVSELGCQLVPMIAGGAGGVVASATVLALQAKAAGAPPSPLPTSVALLVFGLGGIVAIGSVAFRYANLVTTNLGVNGMIYLAPVLALVWLWLFATITVARPSFLAAGAFLVLTANAGAAFQGRRSHPLRQRGVPSRTEPV